MLPPACLLSTTTTTTIHSADTNRHRKNPADENGKADSARKPLQTVNEDFGTMI